MNAQRDLAEFERLDEALLRGWPLPMPRAPTKSRR